MKLNDVAIRVSDKNETCAGWQLNIASDYNPKIIQLALDTPQIANFQSHMGVPSLLRRPVH